MIGIKTCWIQIGSTQHTTTSSTKMSSLTHIWKKGNMVSHAALHVRTMLMLHNHSIGHFAIFVMSCPQSFEQVYFTSYNGTYVVFFVRQGQPFDMQWFLFIPCWCWLRCKDTKSFPIAQAFPQKFFLVERYGWLRELVGPQAWIQMGSRCGPRRWGTSVASVEERDVGRREEEIGSWWDRTGDRVWECRVQHGADDMVEAEHRSKGRLKTNWILMGSNLRWRRLKSWAGFGGTPIKRAFLVV